MSVQTCFAGYGTQRVAYFDGVQVSAHDLGLDDVMFAEWVQHLGQPRCGGFKKSGERCNFAPVGFKCDGLEFAEQHRVVMCHLHKQPERQILDGGAVLIKPTAWHQPKQRAQTIRRQKAMGLLSLPHPATFPDLIGGRI